MNWALVIPLAKKAPLPDLKIDIVCVLALPFAEANAVLTDNPDDDCDAWLKVGGKTTVSQKLSLLPLSTTRGWMRSVPMMPRCWGKTRGLE